MPRYLDEYDDSDLDAIQFHQWVSADLDGQGDKDYRLFDVPCKSEYNFWASVTDVPCPLACGGTIRWHEGGYVPGYRICDHCERHFLAHGDTAHPALIE